ncbi:helix-turn-helix domain-containing protein [Paenibacillus elgii]|uniref:helix-turn-helix domain-containing protein n=1 Tax=Paenibacillus elgii TaxID=189691 RepID=UPI00203E6159|nr:helix-turn-helix transcriptional regulator [Paenibacillus elgii]MCM3273061.1 helix-turn-helix transcriptional regulator [Paenibacillus elgii]
MPLKSNLKQILDERNISIRQLSKDTNYRFESVRLLYNDEMERFPRDLIEVVCSYLQVPVSDLLVLETNE